MDAEVVENPRNNELPTFGNGGTSELKIALSYLNSVFASSESQRKRKITVGGLAKELREELGIIADTTVLSELFEEAEELGLVTITGKVSNGRDYRRYRLTPEGQDMVSPGNHFSGFVRLGKQADNISHYYANKYQK